MAANPPYTIGLNEVVISDVPREKQIQRALNLGATDELRAKVLRQRSNVSDYVYDDMTNTKLAPDSFDYRPIPFPDHKRHYKLSELQALLSRHFREVAVLFAVCKNKK